MYKWAGTAGQSNPITSLPSAQPASASSDFQKFLNETMPTVPLGGPTPITPPGASGADGADGALNPMSKYMREDLDANANFGGDDDYAYGAHGDKDLGGGWGGSGYRFDAEPASRDQRG